MPEITGISSQIESLVAQYRYSISKKVTSLETRKTSLNARLSVLTDLKSKLAALNTMAKDLKATGTSSKFNVFSVDSSLSSVVTATATSSAAAGTHTLLVTQLAKADTVISSQLTSAATTISTTESAGTKSIRITVNGTSTDLSFAIAAGESNSTVLGNIAAAINASSAVGVTASVVSDTSGTSRLVFTSKQTGSTQAVSMSDLSGTVLNTIGLGAGVISGRTVSTATTGGFLYSSTSLLDAKMKLDGIDITRTTNSVSDVLTGVTLDLKGVQASSDTPVTLKIGSDKTKIKIIVEDFIKTYNDALTFLSAKTSVNPDKKTREILASDQGFKDLKISLRGLIGSAVSSVTSGNPSLLSEIGITASSTGTLSLNSSKFDDALASDVRKVSDLFNSSNGIAVRLNALVETFASTNGQIDIAKDGTQSALSSVKTNLERTNAQIDRKVKLFRDQFLALQSALNRINQQSQTFSRLSMSLYGY